MGSDYLDLSEMQINLLDSCLVVLIPSFCPEVFMICCERLKGYISSDFEMEPLRKGGLYIALDPNSEIKGN